jgi:hypothetical protein
MERPHGAHGPKTSERLERRSGQIVLETSANTRDFTGNIHHTRTSTHKRDEQWSIFMMILSIFLGIDNASKVLVLLIMNDPRHPTTLGAVGNRFRLALDPTCLPCCQAGNPLRSRCFHWNTTLGSSARGKNTSCRKNETTRITTEWTMRF